jgi:type IV pilus assembly protein PilF
MIRAVLSGLGLALLVGCVSQQAKLDALDAKTDAHSRARAHAELGIAYFDSQQYGVAREELKIAIESDPKHAPAYNYLGLVHMALNENAEAERAFKQALKIDSEDSATNNNYGMFLCMRKGDKAGLKHFMTALKNPLYSTPYIAYANAGICARTLGDEVKAEEWLRKALTLQPDQPQALYHLADLSFKRGELGNARGLITRHLQYTIPAAEALWLAARIEHQMGDRNALASYGVLLNNRYPGAPQTRAFNEGRFQ